MLNAVCLFLLIFTLENLFLKMCLFNIPSICFLLLIKFRLVEGGLEPIPQGKQQNSHIWPNAGSASGCVWHLCQHTEVKPMWGREYKGLNCFTQGCIGIVASEQEGSGFKPKVQLVYLAQADVWWFVLSQMQKDRIVNSMQHLLINCRM